MKNLYIIGGSGTGKTTLAKNLQEWYPKKFKRIVQFTTREKREGETEGVDYNFITHAQWKEYFVNKNFFESIEFQFGKGKEYGCLFSQLEKEKWNVLVMSIEGLFSGLKNSTNEDETLIFHIIADVDPDIMRNERNYIIEQNYNISVLRTIFNDFKESFVFSNTNKPKYIEISLSQLKEIRNSKEKILKFLFGDEDAC